MNYFKETPLNIRLNEVNDVHGEILEFLGFRNKPRNEMKRLY